MADLIKQAGFGDESLPTGRLEKYSAKKEKIDRVAIAWLENDEPQFVFAGSYYIPGEGYILHKPGFEKIIGQSPKNRYGTIVLIYQTDKDGELLRNEDDKPIMSYEIKPWFFSPKKFSDLRNIHKKYKLSNHDLEFTCVEEKYQQITMMPHPESFLQKMLEKENHKKKILAKVEEIKAGLMDGLGRDLSEEKLKEILSKEDDEGQKPRQESNSKSSSKNSNEDFTIEDDDDSSSVIDEIDGIDFD